MLATKRLKIAANIAPLPTWTNEMESFTARISTTGRESAEALTSAIHDDLVIGTALCSWAAEASAKPRPKLRML